MPFAIWQHQQRVHPGDLPARQLHPLGGVRVQPEPLRFVRAEQPVVEVAAGRPPGVALPADQLPGLDDVPCLDAHLREMRVDAAIAVAIVDHDGDRQRVPEVLLVQPSVVRLQVADPADVVVEVAARGKNGAAVGCADPVAAGRRDVDPVVEPLTLDQATSPARVLEAERQAALERPDVAGEVLDWRGRRNGGRRRTGVGVGLGTGLSGTTVGRGRGLGSGVARVTWVGPATRSPRAGASVWVAPATSAAVSPAAGAGRPLNAVNATTRDARKMTATTIRDGRPRRDRMGTGRYLPREARTSQPAYGPDGSAARDHDDHEREEDEVEGTADEQVPPAQRAPPGQRDEDGGGRQEGDARRGEGRV